MLTIHFSDKRLEMLYYTIIELLLVVVLFLSE